MESIYTFIAGADPIRRVKSQSDILDKIFLQTFECARFIVRYAGNTSFCKSSSSVNLTFLMFYSSGLRTIARIWSSKDEVIQGFLSAFDMLQAELDRNVNMNTQVVLFRVMDRIESIGM